MFYTKHEGKQIPIDGVYTNCFYCRKEFEVDSEMLHEILRDGDMHSTQIACCSGDHPILLRIK